MGTQRLKGKGKEEREGKETDIRKMALLLTGGGPRIAKEARELASKIP